MNKAEHLVVSWVAKKIQADLALDVVPARTKNFLKMQHRILYRSVNKYLKKRSHAPCDAELWEMISELHQNYVSWRWGRFGERLNLCKPLTLAEKIEWLKLNDHRSFYIRLTDKLSVRSYVLEMTGQVALLNKLIGVYDSTKDIPIESLPEKFVIKTNRWGGGDVLIVKNRKFATKERLVSIEKHLCNQFSSKKAEWPYWHIEPRVLVEEYIEDQFNQLIDYKVFCFNGRPKFVMVCKDGFTMHKRLYFDLDWKLMPFSDAKYPKIDDQGKGDFPRPESLDNMIRHAEQLSQGCPFVRVDFYDLFGVCRFGEMTFYPQSGIGCRFVPIEWNALVGRMLTMPKPYRNPRYAYGVKM